MKSPNEALATIFHSMAGLLAARKDNPHRVRAYRRAADALLQLSEDVAEIARRDELQNIPGIGKDLSAKIKEYLACGRIQAYEELKTPLPVEVKAWSDLPGFSEPMVYDLYFRLGITTLEDLERLARSHLLRTLPGMNLSTESILAAIEMKRNGGDSLVD